MNKLLNMWHTLNDLIVLCIYLTFVRCVKKNILVLKEIAKVINYTCGDNRRLFFSNINGEWTQPSEMSTLRCCS